MRERSASKINQDLANIDPRLREGLLDLDVKKSTASSKIDEELENEQVLTDEITMQANQIISAISGISSDAEISLQVGEKDLQVGLEHILLEALEDTPIRDESDPVHASAEDFIRFFAHINVIRNRNAARLTDEKFQEDSVRWVAIGNSREPPTRFLFSCPHREWGCTFSARVLAPFEIHVARCKISEEKPFVQKELRFPCRKAGCSRRFGAQGSRNRHELEHAWVPLQCDRGCTDGKYFQSKESYDNHVNRWHRDMWDTSTTCPVSKCTRTTSFPSRQAYNSHLVETHRLSMEQVAQYKVATKQEKPTFGLRACPHQDCSHLDRKRKRLELESHLRSRVKGGHGLTADEATKMVDDMLQQL